MIIISDASVLSAWAEIGELDLRRVLYGRIVIPAIVRGECSHAHSPRALADYFLQSDPWICLDSWQTVRLLCKLNRATDRYETNTRHPG